jgi:hypothetical protein
MQSSALGTCRALVLLAFAIAMPTLAMFGPAMLGDMANRLLYGVSAPLAGATPHLGVGSPSRETNRPPVSREAPQFPPPIPSDDQRQPPQAATIETRPLQERPILASYQTAAINCGKSARSSQPDEAEAIQRRLRELGAIYYALEPWGNEGNYRFSCRIAISGNSLYTRYFEATAQDGFTAMVKVLRQIEDWRSVR